MSSLEVNKIIGAIVATALTLMVIGTIGNALVRTDHRAAPVAVAVAATEAAPKEATPKAAAAIVSAVALLASADVAKGKKVFKKCTSCHTSNSGGKNRVGPNLWNIVNSERGKSGGFKYSKALVAKSGNWTYESLDAFLTKPKAYIKGTRMSFAGIRKAADRAALIAYLRGLSDAPASLP